MNYLKKLISLCVMLVLTAGLVGCGAKSPSKVVSDSLDAIKNGEDATFTAQFNGDVSKEENKGNSDEEYSESFNKITESMKNISYKINSEKIDGDTATVNVTVNGPDLASVFSQFFQQAFANAFSDAFSGQTLSEEETNAKYDKMLSDLLDNTNYTDRTMDITLVKENKEWKIKDENQLVELVTNLNPDALSQLGQ